MNDIPNYITNAGKYIKDNEIPLRKKYGNDHIAVIDDKVIDNDSDISRLLKRIGNKKCLVMKINDVINPRVCHINSPKLASKGVK